jgi:hypothetical protein
LTPEEVTKKGCRNQNARESHPPTSWNFAGLGNGGSFIPAKLIAPYNRHRTTPGDFGGYAQEQKQHMFRLVRKLTSRGVEIHGFEGGD